MASYLPQHDIEVLHNLGLATDQTYHATARFTAAANSVPVTSTSLKLFQNKPGDTSGPGFGTTQLTKRETNWPNGDSKVSNITGDKGMLIIRAIRINHLIMQADGTPLGGATLATMDMSLNSPQYQESLRCVNHVLKIGDVVYIDDLSVNFPIATGCIPGPAQAGTAPNITAGLQGLTQYQNGSNLWRDRRYLEHSINLEHADSIDWSVDVVKAIVLGDSATFATYILDVQVNLDCWRVRTGLGMMK